jgi:hypothetical protein
MNHMIIPPFDPKQSEPVRPNMVYIKKSLSGNISRLPATLRVNTHSMRLN